ncbi:MAG: transposase, partial [Thermoanaerobaculia bacterium]
MAPRFGWHLVWREIVIGTLSRAQRLYPVDIHAFVFMSNHYHLLLSVPDAQTLARFMGYVNSKLAREIGRLTGWRDKIWSRRYQAVVVSEEEFAQVGRLRYVLAHGVKEGLVDHPADWPGANTVTALLEGRSLQ